MAEIKLPQIENMQDENSFEIEDDGIYEGGVCRSDFSGKRAERVSFSGIVFKGAAFSGAQLYGADISDVRFENCDLSNAILGEAVIYRVQFLGCRLTGADFSSAHMKDAVFKDCGGKYSNFRFSKIENAAFKGCAMQGADFSSVKFIKTLLLNDDFSKAQMSGASLGGIDLSSCIIDGLGARIEDLRGAVISLEQTVVAAKIAGLTIK